MIVGWTLPALLLLSPLPRRWRRAAARYTMMAGLRLFARFLTLAGAYRLDLAAIDALRGGPPLILAPNHPTSIDAMLLPLAPPGPRLHPEARAHAAMSSSARPPGSRASSAATRRAA